jgi:uncharacterized delta-60 repeat protein
VRFALESLEGRSLLSAGTLDPGFDGDGRAVTDFFGDDDAAIDVAVGFGGRVVAVGSTTRDGNTDFAVAAYGANGQLDAGFGVGGKVAINAYVNSNGVIGTTNVPDGASGVAIMADGRIVVVGHAAGNVALLRLNTNGTLDASFGTQGVVNTDFGRTEAATRVALLPDGGIVVGGIQSYGLIGSEGDFLLARYHSNGQLDTSFGDGGKVVMDLHGDETLRGLAVAADGKILIAGTTSYGARYEDIVVARFNSNGSRDNGFDGDGVRMVDLGDSRDYGRAVALQADGKIVVAGYSFYGFVQRSLAVLRFNGDGSLDGSFDGDGMVLRQYTNVTPRAEDVAIQANGRIVVAGIFQNDSDPWHLHNDFGVARFEANGAADQSFGNGGLTMTNFGGWSTDEARAVAIQPDGMIVLAGHVGELGTGGQNFALARYRGDASSQPPAVGAVMGFVYADMNRNGVRDLGERGLRGWHIYVDSNRNGAYDSGEPTTRTDASGRYSLDGLPAGSLILRDGGTLATPGWSRIGSASIIVTAGPQLVSRNFGFKPNTVRGIVYNDLNGNGARDSGEPGLARQIVFMDHNVNHRWDYGEPVRITDAQGVYQFTDLVLEEGTPFWGTMVYPQRGWRARDGQVIPNPMTGRTTMLDLWLVRSV